MRGRSRRRPVGFQMPPRMVPTYNVFIGSPQGLEEERTCFHNRLDLFSRVDTDGDVRFHPVSWEHTVGGAGRPQSRINEYLARCEYAVFVWHDRWGSPPGGGETAGTAEEFAYAEKLHKQGIIIDIAILFKKIEPMKRTGKQLKAVLVFREKIEREQKYLHKEYSSIDQFKDLLHSHLAGWYRSHRRNQAFSAGSFDARTRNPLGPLSSQTKYKQSGMGEQFGMSLLRTSRNEDYRSPASI
jgi:hypothetical protein